MQNSRLGRMGKQTLKNRSNFTLLQQISPQQFSSDQPIKNSNTLYLDENGRQTQFSQLMKSNLFKKSIRNDLELSESEVNNKDMYALPIVNTGNSSSSSFVLNGDRSRGKAKLIKSQYLTDRAMLDSVREVDQSSISGRSDAGKSLLSIKRPKAFKRRDKFEQIDFIGGNLYEVEDIISDISKIIDKTKRTNILAPTKQPKSTLKSNKWLNNNFGNLSKLDEMLLNYKTTGDKEQVRIPIIQEYYRESAEEEIKQKVPKVPEKHKSRINYSGFDTKGKNNQEKVSLVVVKWNQLPMIGSKWEPDVYLKLQSYPQQEQYRKVVLKAYAQKIKTYSIFWYSDAGISKPKSSNDKNSAGFKLMSQQQYAKTWQQKYSAPTQLLSEQQKQLLMQFDIEWYRTIIELCYHSGLEDLLEKEHDVGTYQAVMNSIEREEEPSGEVVIRNQLKYLRDYFSQVYTYGSNETTIGLIRVNNDDKMDIKDVQSNFASMLRADESDDIDFCLWAMSQDDSNLLALVQLCGDSSPTTITLNKAHHQIQISPKKPPTTITMLVQSNQSEVPAGNSILLKHNQQNDWQIYPKLKYDTHDNIKYSIKMTEELLFGLLYTVNMAAI